MNRHDTDPPRTPVPADVDAPDRIAYGLTARQLAILAVAALAGYGGFQALSGWLAPAAAALTLLPLAGAVIAVVVGRRDGLPLDVWLLAGLRFGRVPRLQTPGGAGAPALVHTAGAVPLPAPLQLPADALTAAGVLRLPGGATAAVVACGSVNLALRTAGEQAALLAGFGRWLNSLAGPAQIVVSTRPVDLAAHATRLEHAAQRLHQPALATAAEDQAGFLRELGRTRDPLRRQVLVVVHGQPGRGATRVGEDTARALAALGVHTRLLDGQAVTAAVAAAVDPYAPPAPGPRAAPDTPITGPSRKETHP